MVWRMIFTIVYVSYQLTIALNTLNEGAYPQEVHDRYSKSA